MANGGSGSLESREEFAACIKDCGGDPETLQAMFIDTQGSEGDKKSILEQAFRDVVKEWIKNPKGSDLSQFTDLVLLAIGSAQLGICYHTVPFILLSDVLDCVTLDVCENIFKFLEDQVSTWTQPDFYSSGKILLLRMCNDLLRRLSSAQNTVFCGRIQLFLARLFPLSEKSALNLMSHFNLENVTTYNKEAGTEEESAKTSQTKDPDAMEVDDSFDESSGPIDFNLYHKLWSLQDFFRNPTQCYSTEHWKTLVEATPEVLQAFSSYKLEDVTQSSSKKKRRKTGEKAQRRSSFVEHTESHYFAKFLTSEKLMNLQLRDSHFRRHILVQFLILFQYLLSDVKFKSSSQVSTDSQEVWIRDTTAKVYELLAETPPNGAEFATYVKQALKREENWIVWKNDGCPSYEKPRLSQEELQPYPPRKHLGDTYAQTARKIDLGSPELSRLWNLCPDNLEACRLKDRMFVPDVEKFLEEPIEQADPAARIEDEFKVINQPNTAWRALRLLSRNSPHFFQGTTAQIRTQPEYLEHVIVQVAKDLKNT